MRVRAADDVRACIDRCVRERLLVGGYLIAALGAPMRSEDQNICAVILELLYTGRDVALAQARPAGTVDTDFQAVLGREHLGFTAGSPSNIRCIQSSLRIRDAFRAEVIRVVVAERDALHAALHENVSIR